MFEKQTFRCPNCDAESQEPLRDGDTFTCPGCQTGFRVLLDESTGRVGLVEERGRELPEPLYLPKGSVRAGVALAMACSCWWLVLVGSDVPGYLLSLLLTILGYYFGFRTKVKASASRIFDATATETTPLFLPAGFVRWSLIAGFAVSAIVLLARGQLAEAAYLEFFIILAGLVAGYLVGKFVGLLAPTPIALLFNHLKAVAVIAAAAWLAVLFVSGGYQSWTGASAAWPILLCSVVSFYYGSRT